MARFIVFTPSGEVFEDDDIEYCEAYALETYTYDREYYAWYCSITKTKDQHGQIYKWLRVPESHVPREFRCQKLIFA